MSYESLVVLITEVAAVAAAAVAAAAAAAKLLLLMPHAVTGWFCEKEVSAVLLFVSPAARASAPSRHSDRWTQGACRRTGATGWFCKKKVSAVLLFCFSPVRKKLLGFVQECFRHTL